MENYILQENETILFRGSAILLPNGKSSKKEEEQDVLLTNLNIVFISKIKKLFRTVSEVSVFSVSDVKIYDESIQIIRRKSIVDIYLKSREVFADFKKEKYAKEFCDKALKLISGHSKFVRSVKKTQKIINETNEALDIDVIDVAKNTAAVACNIAISAGTSKEAKKGTKFVGKVAEAILNKSRKNESKTLVEGLEENKEN